MAAAAVVNEAAASACTLRRRKPHTMQCLCRYCCSSLAPTSARKNGNPDEDFPVPEEEPADPGGESHGGAPHDVPQYDM